MSPGTKTGKGSVVDGKQVIVGVNASIPKKEGARTSL